MRMGFEQPGYFWGIAALVALLALYLWYRRSRTLETSALFLWDKPETAPQTGSRFALQRLPWSFYVEALVLLLLTAAAAVPFLMEEDGYPPLAVIVDNSYSMQAAMPGEDSPRLLGEKYLDEYLKRFPARRVIRVSAGTSPRLVADGTDEVPMTAFGRSEDTCVDLAEAIALVRSRSAHAEILVITDHAPDFPLTDDISWYSTGVAKPNTALVNVRRQADRILLEAVNNAAIPQRVRAVLKPGGQGEWFTLDCGERRKVVLRLPAAAEKLPVEVFLECESDPLLFDNRTVLLPEARAPLSYRIAPSLPEDARRSIDEALRGNPDFTAIGEPELLFDTPGRAAGKHHRLLWHGVDRSDTVSTGELISILAGSELVRGLPVDGLVWSALPEVTLPGTILCRRGSTPLLSEFRRAEGFTDVHLNLNLARSNLVHRPFWPIFFWNLADTLRRDRPGPEHVNYRSGDIVRVRLPDSSPLFLTLRLPDGSEQRVELVNRQGYFVAGAPGVYDIDGRWSVAVSAVDPAESDLRTAAPYRIQSRMLPDALEYPRRRLAFAFLLLALALLMYHQYKLGQSRRIA